MAPLLLIHGGWHGGWCWERLVPLLEAKGHRVLAPDLAGLGQDRTPPKEVTLDLWTNRMIDLIRSTGEKAVLVGHSRGGMVLSAVAERAPELVDRLVYLTAFLAKDGQALMKFLSSDTEAMLQSVIVADREAGVITMRKEGMVECFYGQCSPEDIAFAEARLRPEPIMASINPVEATEARFGTVPRYYIECTEDRAISLACQRRMQAELPCAGLVTLKTDHSPFFSAPAALADALIDIAGR
jgi:pimeloyl-ACP methyl ester carboxylesterase